MSKRNANQMSLRPLRSSAQLDRDDYEGWAQRACLKGEGFDESAFRGRPVVGICNSWSEFVHCNAHLRGLAQAVRRGVLEAGGFPLEFPVMSLGEPFMKPTTMLYRNLMAMDVEESIRAYPMDAVVVLVGCDKTIAAGLLGVASADIPAIVLTGGPQTSATWHGRAIGTCTDCWALGERHRLGEIDDAAWKSLEDSLITSPGHCSTMGTASTMACLAEAIGLAPMGSAAIPAADTRRLQMGERTGRRAVELALHGPTPSQILSARAFENALRVLHAIGGSTNAVIHIVALAGRVGLELPLRAIDQLGRDTPRLTNIKPSGEFLMEDFYAAGGVPAVMREIRERLDFDVESVNGDVWRDEIDRAQNLNHTVIAPKDQPLSPDGTISVLFGSLCPDGAVLKHSAADPHLLKHEGPAVVFDDLNDLERRINRPDLDVRADSVLVLRNVGPVGAPGMPECGQLPIPDRLLKAGVNDMVRISDARMSGTAYGTVVLHVAPESAIGGPLALIETGDKILLDTGHRRLDVLVETRELERRRDAHRRVNRPKPARGYVGLYVDHVLQANQGCDFDFLRAASRPELRGEAALR